MVVIRSDRWLVMRKLYLALSLAVLMLTVMAGCGAPVTAGTVESRHFEPAHDSTWYQPIYRTACVPSSRTTTVNGRTTTTTR